MLQEMRIMHGFLIRRTWKILTHLLNKQSLQIVKTIQFCVLVPPTSATVSFACIIIWRHAEVRVRRLRIRAFASWCSWHSRAPGDQGPKAEVHEEHDAHVAEHAARMSRSPSSNRTDSNASCNTKIQVSAGRPQNPSGPSPWPWLWTQAQFH